MMEGDYRGLQRQQQQYYQEEEQEEDEEEQLCGDDDNEEEDDDGGEFVDASTNHHWHGSNNNNNYQKLARKRRYEEDEDEYEDNGTGLRGSKRQTRAREVVFRIVVASNRIGRVIGKQGNRINQLRESTGARIKIADPVSPQEERVIIISSKTEDLEETSSAEHGLVDIASVILEDSGENTAPIKSGSRHGAPNMIRLLIAGSQAGRLIGVSGATINEMRKKSGAMIQVMSENLLPVCASASETDRLVQVSGEVSEVLRALEQIGSILREHPPKEVISMKPTYFGPNMGNSSMLYPHTLFPGYTMPPMHPAFPYMGYGVSPASTSLPKIKTNICVPSSVIGGLIGKRGSNISRIRSVSGATVKVTGERDVATRTIYFEGTAPQVATAQNMVNSLIADQPKFPPMA